MAETIAVDLNINTGNTLKTLKEIRQEIKDTKDALLAVGQGSPEYAKLARAAGNAEEKLQNVNKSIAALDPKKLGAQFVNLGSTIASGFQAATGAAALFGVSGKKLEEQMLKVQAATAVAQGIQGLTDASSKLKLVWSALKATNPFGQFMIVIGLVGTALFFLKDKVKIIGDAFDFFGNIVNKVVKFFKDASDSILGTSFAIDEIKAKTKEYEQVVIRIRKNIADAKEKEDKKDKERAAEQKRLHDEAIAREKEKRDKFLENLDAVEKSLDERDEIEGMRRQALRDQSVIDEDEAKKNALAQSKLNFDEQQMLFEEEEEALAFAQSISDAKVSIKLQELDAIMGIAQLGEQLAGKNEQLANAMFLVQKAAAIASIIVNTQREISSIAATNALLGPAGIALTASQSVLAKVRAGIGIATILATSINKFKGGGGSPSLGGSGGSGGGGGATQGVPLNAVSNTQTVLPSEQIENSKNGAMVRAYVVETEITQTQKNINSIQNKAKF